MVTLIAKKANTNLQKSLWSSWTRESVKDSFSRPNKTVKPLL